MVKVIEIAEDVQNTIPGASISYRGPLKPKKPLVYFLEIELDKETRSLVAALEVAYAETPDIICPGDRELDDCIPVDIIPTNVAVNFRFLLDENTSWMPLEELLGRAVSQVLTPKTKVKISVPYDDTQDHNILFEVQIGKLFATKTRCNFRNAKNFFERSR